MKARTPFPHTKAARVWASVFGKTTFDTRSQDYKTIVAIGECLIEEGFGVVHGGYDGGAMGAVSQGATQAIRRLGLSPKLNVGVPHVLFDAECKRVDNATFTKTQKDIFGRLQVVGSGDIAVVCPRGGIGTQLELTIVIHENKQKRAQGQKPQPLIFYVSKTGTDWKSVFANMAKHLKFSTKDVYFVKTIPEFRKLVQKLK